MHGQSAGVEICEYCGIDHRDGVPKIRLTSVTCCRSISYLLELFLTRGIALVCLLLAAILFLPIPLGKMLPAISICLFSLAILERDGLAALLAGGVTAISIIIAWGVLYALIKSSIFIVSNALAL